MEKGIWIGNTLDYYKDLPWLIEKGFTAVYIGTNGGLSEQLNRFNFALQEGISTFIVDVRNSDWRQTVDTVPAQYFYFDEPYLYNVDEQELLDRRDYIRKVRPESKFVIGDIRAIQNWRYEPIPEMYYTYSSYTDNWYLPLLGIAIPIGLGDQSPSIKRIHKKVEGRFPFIWVYGKNKLLCHPDEYHELRKTCNDLGINLMMLYAASSSDKYKFNDVSREQVLKNIDHFLNDTKPYTRREWWQRLVHRLKLSFNHLRETKSFSEFIDKLF
jgi:hypothetical protein